jgi:hypothetical protein
MSSWHPSRFAASDSGLCGTLAQELGRKVQHQRLIGLGEAGKVFDRHRVVHRSSQCSFTCGSVRRVIRRASEAFTSRAWKRYPRLLLLPNRERATRNNADAARA